MNHLAKVPDSWHSGIPSIDQDHQNIFDIINYCWQQDHAHDLSQCGCFEHFIKCLAEHFLHEENHMKESRYPDYESHKNHHQNMLKKLEEKKSALKAGENLLAFCNSILFDDMVKTDLHYNNYLLKKGLIPA